MARRVKSIMHGGAEDTRVYHREHRSKRGRAKGGKSMRSYSHEYVKYKKELGKFLALDI